MQTEIITFTTGDPSVRCASEVERIANFVSEWGRKSDANPTGCDHPQDQFCEQYGCSSFEELAKEIRERFL